jgi:hypothetical protein
MFITNGKSLFSNTGLLVSILILIVLLILSYNKCYVSRKELFIVEENYKKPENVRINISGGAITLNFTINNRDNMNLPTKFLVVLSQYDNNMKNTGKNEFFLSNEFELNSVSQLTETTVNTNLCTILNGRPVCQYKFSNLDVRDKDGNLYYYKLGISSIFSNDINSEFVMPENISSLNKLFTLDSSAENQSRQFKDFQTYQTITKKSGNGSISPNIYDKTMATADGQYEFIKSQLGGYPDNLLLDSLELSQGTLTDMVNKTLAPIIINAKVSA